MREIKFRGIAKEDTLHIKAGSWIYGHFVDGGDPDEDDPFIVGDLMEAAVDFFCPEFWAPVRRETVGHLLERKDCDGADLWTGDIVNIKILDRIDGRVLVEKNRVIEIRGDCAGVEWGRDFSEVTLNEFATLVSFSASATRIKKIGNIHDNPELLEVQP